MTEKRKQILIDLLEKSIVVKKRQLSDSHAALRDVQQAAMGSWSVGGDRMHAESAYDMVDKALTDAENLRESVNKAGDKDTNNIVAPCFIKISYQKPESRISELYLVDLPVKLENVQLISPNSPLGSAILGKKTGDKISYEIGNKKFFGEITAIE